MPALLDILYRDHENMKKMFAVLEAELAAFDHGDPPDYDLVVDILDYCITYPDLYHHPLEDLIMERVKEREPKAAKWAVDLHDEHNRLMAQTRLFLGLVHDVRQQHEVARATFSKEGAAFLAAYRKHMRYEDEELFAAAARKLTDKDWKEIDESWDSPYDPLFANRSERRYSRLRDAILARYGSLDTVE